MLFFCIYFMGLVSEEIKCWLRKYDQPIFTPNQRVQVVHQEWRQNETEIMQKYIYNSYSQSIFVQDGDSEYLSS